MRKRQYSAIFLLYYRYPSTYYRTTAPVILFHYYYTITYPILRWNIFVTYLGRVLTYVLPMVVRMTKEMLHPIFIEDLFT